MVACVSLVISLWDIRGLSALFEEKGLVKWLSTGVAALNTVGYSLMILNVYSYIYSPSLIRLLLQTVLAKFHISFMAMLLHMSEGSKTANIMVNPPAGREIARWILTDSSLV
ncbi:hypothetical protein C8Q72DRAFT_846139 [Fomitopsis betulina]|nr:hypothetical protein C8Q72DRAFT_846139 [Fomitopsis betulina]